MIRIINESWMNELDMLNELRVEVGEAGELVLIQVHHEELVRGRQVDRLPRELTVKVGDVLAVALKVHFNVKVCFPLSWARSEAISSSVPLIWSRRFYPETMIFFFIQKNAFGQGKNGVMVRLTGLNKWPLQ